MSELELELEQSDPLSAERTIVSIRRKREEEKGVRFRNVTFALDTQPIRDFIEAGFGKLRGKDGTIDATEIDAQVLLDAIIKRKAELIGREAELIALIDSGTDPEKTYPPVPDVEDLDPTQAKERVAKQRATEIAQVQAADAVLDTVSDEELEELTYLYPEWTVGKAYEIDHKVRYQGVLYKVIQAHTSQADWTPDITASLFVRFRTPTGGLMEWVAGEQVDVEDQRTYQGTTYRVIQAHTTQADWTPDVTPTLWALV